MVEVVNWFSVFWEPSVTGSGVYAYTLLLGLKTTLILSTVGAVVALAAGSIVGVMRTLPSPWARGPAAAYVEVFRNIPFLAQLFIWFYVVPELVPDSLGTWLKQPESGFYTAAIGLGLYMSARVAEQLRAGVEAIPRGKKMAATALGLTLPQSYRYVLLPIAFRNIFPPLTSELLNTIKNSSVALTLGVVELTQSARNMNEYTFKTFQAFAAVTLIYLVLNLLVTLAMRAVERRIAIPGFLSGT